MTKSNSTLVGIPPDPHYHPLPPSVEDLLTYEYELCDEGQYLTYEWAIREIKEHLLNWVRVGLVAEKVRYYKLWKGRFSSWQEHCEKAIGKAKWQISKLIRAARAVIYLAEAGFETLPNCEAQASKLLKTAPQETDLIESWRRVLEEVPKHLISANAIGRVFGEEPKKKRMNINSDLYQRLKERARELGISVEQLIEEWLDEEEIIEPETVSEFSSEESSEEDPNMLVTNEMMARWQADLEVIVREYDFQDWLTLIWFKFLVPV